MSWRKLEGKDVIITTTDGEKYPCWVFYFSPADECEDGKNSLDVEFEDGHMGSFDESDILSIEIISNGGK